MTAVVSRAKRKQGILHALLPGARLDRNTNKILVHAGTTNEIIRFNVGGSSFETYKSTLRAIPKSPLADDVFLARHYREGQGDYFFDRDPEIFHCVLNYFRTGELHLPASVCGPVVHSELEYWGVDEVDIEECCWSRYATWATTLQDLRKLEEDRKANLQMGEYPYKDNSSCFREVRSKAWKFYAQPSSSLPAKIYCFTSLSAMFLSIFSFCANTVPDMQINDTAPSSSNLSSSAYLNATVATTIGQSTNPVLRYIDISCLIFFSLELLIRFLVSPHKVKFILLPMSIMEFLALLPDLIDIILHAKNVSFDYHHTLLWMISFLKLLRVFRIFRLMRHVSGLWILFYTLKASIKDLLLLLLFVSVGMLISSSLIYFAESSKQPSSFSSIPKCFWWAVVTMTTVGYGDMVPQTEWGYLIGAATGISGVLMIGFTVPVLVNNFVLYYNHTTSTIRREQERKRLAGEKRRGHLHGNHSGDKTYLDKKDIHLGDLKPTLTVFIKDANSNENVCSDDSNADTNVTETPKIISLTDLEKGEQIEEHCA